MYMERSVHWYKERLMKPSKPAVAAALLVWCGLAVVSSLYVTLPIGSLLVSHFHISLAESAWSSSAFSLFYALGFLICGPLSERIGRRNTILGGILLLTIISPLIGLSSSFYTLVLLRALQGAAAATFAPSALAYIMETFPADSRVTAIGFVSTGFLVAGIVGQVFASYAGDHLGWPSIFYMLGGVYFLTVLFTFRFLPKDEPKQAATPLRSLPTEMISVLIRRPLYYCYLITLTLLFSFVGMYTVLGHYLSGPSFGLSTENIMTIRAVGVVGLLISPFAGALVARFGSYRVLQSGQLLAVVGLIGLTLGQSLLVPVLFSIVFVTGISVCVLTLISLVGQLAGVARGIAVSLYTFILFIGATVGPVLAISMMNTSGGYSSVPNDYSCRRHWFSNVSKTFFGCTKNYNCR
jgi:YNFM family putative membrane transporter